jgi:SAM-dependent methyltransferase
MSKINKDNWDERFSSVEYVYGTNPNAFLKEQLAKLSPGRLLMLGEGEGRNAVYAAKKKWQVDAVDFSDQARLKALKLAAKEKVNINYTICNLNEYQPQSSHYDAIGIIFIHLDKSELEKIFAVAKEALKKGEELYYAKYSRKISLVKPRVDLKWPICSIVLDEIASMFKGLETVSLGRKSLIILNEGILHQGEAMVIRLCR